jgi:hypothetical protein
MCESDSPSNRGTLNKGIAIADFLQKMLLQATPNAKRQTYSKPEKSVRCQKNSPKAVKFDKDGQPLVLQCVSRPGVASQASFASNEKLQGKSE